MKYLCEFIDKFVSTESEIESIKKYIDYQTHHHTRTCKKKVKNSEICRFNLPILPIKKTETLMPFEFESEKLKKCKSDFKNIVELLNSNECDTIVTFEVFLKNQNSWH